MEEPSPDSFPDYVIGLVMGAGVILRDSNGEVRIPDIDPLQLALDRFDSLVQEFDELDSQVGTGINILDKNISEYHKILETIPTDSGEVKIPPDLIRQYRKSLQEIKEKDIERKLKSGKKLSTEENMILLQFKNAKATLNFLTKDTVFWKQINTIHDTYTRLIEICKANRQNLTYIGDRTGLFVKTAKGVRDFLRSVASLTPEERARMTDVTTFLNKIMDMTTSVQSLIEFTLNNALNLTSAVNGMEIVGKFEGTFREMSTEAQKVAVTTKNTEVSRNAQVLREIEEAMTEELKVQELQTT